MSIPTFTAGYPPDGSTLGNTKSTIRNNLDGTFQTVAVNHFDNNQTTAGKHKFIQLPTPVAPSTTGATELLLYNGTPDSTNFYVYYVRNGQTVGSTTAVQMTRNEFPQQIGANGYSWLPGGFLLQWGSKTPATNNTVVTFPLTFTAVYSLTLGGEDPSSSANHPIAWKSLTTSQFTISTASSSFTSLSWFAIGK